MKKKVSILLIVLFIFTLVPFGAWATDYANDTIIKSGDDPIWVIEDVDAPDKVAIGKEFDVRITVRNMGTGIGMWPEIGFKEFFSDYDGYSSINNFSVVGSENSAVYNPDVAKVASGERRVFIVKLKSSESIRELSEGGYKIVPTIKSYSGVDKVGQNGTVKRFEVSGTAFTVKVNFSLTDPTFIVQDIAISPQISGDIKETTATIKVKNVSETKANAVRVSLIGKDLDGGEKNIKVEDISSSKLVGDIKGNETFSVSYKIKLNTARKDNEMTFKVDYDGAEKASEEVLNLPLPLNDSSNGKVPKVIINKYTVSPTKAYAGNNVTLTLFIENTNARNVSNVQITLKVPENESTGSNTTVSSGTVFSPINSSNTFFIDKINAKTIITKDIDMYVDSNAVAKTYVMPVEIAYEDVDGNEHTINDNVNIPVGQMSDVDIITKSVSSVTQANAPLDFSVEFVNSGKVALSNFKAFLECDNLDVSDQVYYVGNLDVGATDTFSGSIFPSEVGELNGAIVFTYNDSGEEVRMEYPFTTMVEEAMEMDEPMIDEPMINEPAKDMKKTLAIIGAVVVVVACGIVVYKKRKKKKEEEELLND